MTTNDYISTNTLLSDILMECNDVSLTKGFTIGYYRSLVQKALEELAYTTFFETLTVDLPFDKTSFQLEIPNNIFNVRELYLWNGDCCSPTSSVPVKWKRQFNNGKGGTGYTANRKDDYQEYNYDGYRGYNYDENGTPILYANIQNGIIMFSSNCSGYDNVRIVGNGTAGGIGDEPIIPRYLREAVISWCCEKFCMNMIHREPKGGYFGLQKLYAGKVADTWHEAHKRVVSMSTWQKEELNKYLISWKQP